MNLSKTSLLRLCLIVMIGFFLRGVASAQNVVQGVVTDGDEPLPGATVLEKGTSNGTITDLDGKYTLSVSDDATLVFTFIGFQSKEVWVGGQSQINAELEMDISELSEVVVIGYGTQQKKVATGAISKIDSKDLDGYKVQNVKGALDGQVSGLVVSNSSGQPGASQNIYIRGVGTNGNSSPLYVVDGLVVDGIGNINPGDVESVNVLKDAASSAIYGTRAANGVIIITTKKGKDGVGSISYDGFTAYSNPWKKPEMLNAEQYVTLTREKFANAGQSSALDARGFPQVSDPITTDTDWMDVIFDESTQVNHSIRASLGRSYLSLEYWDQNGVIGGEKSNYTRYAARFNSTKDINNLISLGQNIYLNRTQNQNLATNNAFGTVIADAFAYDPLTPVYADTDPLGYGFAQSPWVQKEYINPMSRLFLANSRGHNDEVQGNVYLQVKPLEGLTVRSDFGGSASWWQYRSFTPDYDFHASAFNVDNQISQGGGTSQSFQFENYATYETNIGDHSLNVTAGTSFYRFNAFIEFGGSSRNLPDAEKFNENFQILNMGQDTSDLSFGRIVVPHRIISYYGRFIYDYQDKYLFTGTLRRDASTQFGANNRWGYFPSFSLGWVLSEETFFPKRLVNYAKLRGSWGVNGNDRINSLAYESLLESSYRYTLGREPALNLGTAPNAPSNPDIKWEESVQLDIGLELGFFKDKLTAELDYYIKTTKDLLGYATIPKYFGYVGSPTKNLGEIQNKGIEASLSFRENINDLNFNVRATYTHNKNTVVEVPGTADFIDGWNWPVRNMAITRMTEGLPISHFRGYKTLGIFQSQDEIFSHLNNAGDPLQPNAAPGDLIFDDVNGDGVINSDDITNIGSPWPDHIIGLSLSADFKGFDFNVLFSSQLGQEIYRTYERSDVTFTNYQTFWLDRWTEENPSTELPRLVSTDPNINQRPSDFYVEDGSFLRLRNLQVGYNIPSSLLSKIKLSALRIYFSANNLWTLTGYRGFDPEIGTSTNPDEGINAGGWILDTGIDKGYYPSNKTLGAGISITM